MKSVLKVALATAISFGAHANAQTFTIEDIRVEGLQRVSAGSVFAALPVEVNDLVDKAAVQDSIRALFATGLFENINIERDGDVFVIRVIERPIISEISIEGNKKLKTEQLLDSLRDNGLSEGQIYAPATLSGISKAISRQYVSQGHYGSSVDAKVKELPNSRIAIDIDIEEGKKAKIRGINIVGNTAFSDRTLLKQFESRPAGFRTFFNGKSKYTKEKIAGDIEALESYYLDRGYIRFRVDSTQVAVSDDRKAVFLTINVDEGDVYKINDVEFVGDLVINEKVLNNIASSQEGDTYSRANIDGIKEYVNQSLSNQGYFFAEVQDIPDVKDEDGTVDITMFIDPKKRTHVRRINFQGNYRTEEGVLRREMRQMESAVASDILIERGELRLNRLGYFSNVESETIPVPGTDDQIDVLYTVEEQSSGNFSASLGYAERSGIVVSTSLSENNFFGTGNAIGVSIDRSSFQKAFSFNFNNPYYTVDGVSAGFSIFARETDFDRIRVSTFSTNRLGGTVSFGYPVSEISRLNWGVGYEKLDVQTGLFASPEILSLLENGSKYDLFKFNAGWNQSALNRGVFATRGFSQSLSLELAVPGSDLNYAKVDYRGQKFFPLQRGFSLKFSSRLGYGEGFGDTNRLPFFENYYAGGFGSVRGFERSTLGPRESISRDIFGNVTNAGIRPIGGNVLITGSSELILPLPFIPASSMQASLFVDAGNVFDTKCNDTQGLCYSPDLNELRYSSGLAATWLSPFGPLSFSFAKVLSSAPDEDNKFFQFSVGQTF